MPFNAKSPNVCLVTILTWIVAEACFFFVQENLRNGNAIYFNFFGGSKSHYRCCNFFWIQNVWTMFLWTTIYIYVPGFSICFYPNHDVTFGLFGKSACSRICFKICRLYAMGKNQVKCEMFKKWTISIIKIVGDRLTD